MYHYVAIELGTNLVRIDGAHCTWRSIDFVKSSFSIKKNIFFLKNSKKKFENEKNLSCEEKCHKLGYISITRVTVGNLANW